MKKVRPIRIIVVSLLFTIAIYLLYLATPALFISITFFSFLSLKGGGSLGYKLGFIGSLMLLIAQSYSFKIFSIKGKNIAKSWLNMHCYLSITGGILILIHSGFPFSFTYANFFSHIYPGRGLEGLVGVQGLAAWLILVLIFSGIYGKYLYGKINLRWKPFRHWLLFHITLTGVLYVTGIVHLIITQVLEYVSAI
ncbi:MAG: hypothetical protein QXX95_08090 [Nitrososphaerales archaeon]